MERMFNNQGRHRWWLSVQNGFQVEKKLATKWSDGKPPQPKPKPSSKICPEKLSTDFDFLLQSGQFSDVTIRLSNVQIVHWFDFQLQVYYLTQRWNFLAFKEILLYKYNGHLSILTISHTPGVRTIYSAVTKSSWGRGAQSSMQCSFTTWQKGFFEQ